MHCQHLLGVYPGETPNTARVVFDQPVRAITPGQIAVFYRGETVVGGGIIGSSMRRGVDRKQPNRLCSARCKPCHP
jgi:hypothetical protein